MDLAQLRVGVVGASLAGLSIANVLERAGAAVTVLERGEPSFSERGGGLGLALPLARAVTGDASGAPPYVVHDRRRVWMPGKEWEEEASITSTAYGALWRWLREHLRSTCVHHDRHVVRVEEVASGARVIAADSWAESFDLVVAADGGTSKLRHLVEGPESERSYAGYVLWRGLVPMALIDDERFDLKRRFHVANRGSHHFVAYAIPHHRGGVDERELLNWGWYHPWRPADLTELAAGSRSLSPHVLKRNEDVLGLFAAVERRDRERWPEWVRHVFEQSRVHGAIAPHPVYEVVPGRLAGGRVVLAGDAAHLATPITGAGGRMAMEDALVLGDALASAPSVEAALAAYAEARRADTARIVLEGRQRGAAFRALDDE